MQFFSQAWLALCSFKDICYRSLLFHYLTSNKNQRLQVGLAPCSQLPAFRDRCSWGLTAHSAAQRGWEGSASQAVFQTSPSPGVCWGDCNLSLDSILECACIFEHREVKASVRCSGSSTKIYCRETSPFLPLQKVWNDFYGRRRFVSIRTSPKAALWTNPAVRFWKSTLEWEEMVEYILNFKTGYLFSFPIHGNTGKLLKTFFSCNFCVW